MWNNPSPYTVTNYVTAGIAEGFGKAIAPQNYNIKIFSFEHATNFGGAVLTLYSAGKVYEVTHIDPHSTDGLRQISGLPENVAMSQAAMSQAEMEKISAFTDQFINTKIDPSRQATVRDAFGPDMVAVTLSEDITVFRYYGSGADPIGSWYTPYLYDNPASMLALPQQNSVEFVSTYVIPKGTTVLQGHVAPNFGQPGQGFQIYVAYEDWYLISPQ